MRPRTRSTAPHAGREDRLKVFREFWARYNGSRARLGTALNAQVRPTSFPARCASSTPRSRRRCSRRIIPTAVYAQLIEDIHANLPTLHRHLRLRQRMMGLDKLGYEDLYAPIVQRYDRTFHARRGQGRDARRGGAARQGLPGRSWAKGFEAAGSTGSRAPASARGLQHDRAYGLHPFQLQNFTGAVRRGLDPRTVRQHSMHSFLSDRAQPYPHTTYPIFVAEVASTLNENLLVNSMLAKAKTDDERLVLLGSHLDGLRTTLFRQGLFAEFRAADARAGRQGRAAERREPDGALPEARPRVLRARQRGSAR